MAEPNKEFWSCELLIYFSRKLSQNAITWKRLVMYTICCFIFKLKRGHLFETTMGGVEFDVRHHIPLGNWLASFSFFKGDLYETTRHDHF